MHLAAAILAGCTLFASFDTNSHARALALALRLEVFPESNREDAVDTARFECPGPVSSWPRDRLRLTAVC
jgi:hypothetical protein